MIVLIVIGVVCDNSLKGVYISLIICVRVLYGQINWKRNEGWLIDSHILHSSD